ncbi:DUF1538 domain-containing protein [Agarivorans aestuarii]|uniref:DUF1538 domain-containing protein n=1 Tax=Agarivorans aestuarii TaxID=1563703 RepID=A0ABU7G6G8_9ALTE|nr:MULTISPECIES: DUF1538 domain-containing protein [Agarivorans]MEE1674903.1 DUF1538 domain-containing protein [Agarivorans aestuarii]
MISASVRFLETLFATLGDIFPIVVTILVFQYLVIKRPINQPKQLLLGTAFVVLGMVLFLLGLEQALFPLGQSMAKQLTSAEFLGLEESSVYIASEHWAAYAWIYLFSAAIGFSTTIAEPSLLAVAIKANGVSGGAVSIGGLRISVAIGVALGLALGSYRIVVGDPLHYYIIAGYILVVIQTLFAPKAIIPLAYDSGGVTTSTVTVPLVTALGLGLAESVPGRSPLLDGFGLIAFASLFPIISVLAYAQVTSFLASSSLSGDDDEI